jgi:hypothetical protein
MWPALHGLPRMTSTANLSPTPPDLEPQLLLFAPYCGGLAYRHLLLPALAQLQLGEWAGARPLSDGRSHPFLLRWQGGSAPLQSLHCDLHFPQLPDLAYRFTIPAYQLVYWLMQRQDEQLPVAFWSWLLTGELPGTAESSS